jgi:hypothetical protein
MGDTPARALGSIRFPCARVLATAPLLALVWLVASCTHLHNKTNEELAKAALQDFNDFKKLSGGPYLAMLRNHSKMDAASISFQAEVAKVKTVTIAAGLSRKPWGEIATELNTQEETRADRLRALADELKKLTRQELIATGETERIAQGLKAAAAMLTAAYAVQDKWEARHVLFLSAIKISAELAASGDAPDAASLRKLREDALNQTVTLERYDEKGNPRTETKTVAAILDKDAGAILDGKVTDQIGDYTYNLFNPDAAPGLKVIIFSLGVDLASQQLARAKLTSAYLRDRIAVARTQERILTNPDSLNAATALTILKDRSGKLLSTGTVLSTVNQLRRECDNQPRDKCDNALVLQDAFDVLGTYAFLKTLNDSRWLETTTRVEFLNHQRSIKLSAINALEHEALIARGLQGLLIYHQGGLTEERIANFLRLAQTAALAVIGLGVQ